jgi:hypothetical protein
MDGSSAATLQARADGSMAAYGSDTTAAQADDTPLGVAERILGVPGEAGGAAAGSTQLDRLEQAVRELSAQLSANSRELELWTRLDQLNSRNQRLAQRAQRRQASNQELRELIARRTAVANTRDPTTWSAPQLREFLSARRVAFDDAADQASLVAAAQSSIEAQPLLTGREVSPSGLEMHPRQQQPREAFSGARYPCVATATATDRAAAHTPCPRRPLTRALATW